MLYTLKVKLAALKNVFLLAVVAALCGGSVPVFAKVALEAFQPFTLTFLRFFFAVLTLLPFVLPTIKLNTTLVKRFLPVALVGAANPLLLFIALPNTTASVTPLIYAVVPAMTALYFFLVSGERLGRRQLLGMLLGFAGVAVIVLLPLLDSGFPPSALAGNALIFLAAAAFAAYGIMSKKDQKSYDASPLELVFYFSAVAMLASAPFAFGEMSKGGFVMMPQAKHILAAVFTGVVGTGVFYLAYQYALKY